MNTIVFSIIGWLYVIIRFRNLSKAKAFVDKKYLGSYAAAGNDLMLSAFALFGALSLSIIAVYMIIVFIYRLITGTLDPS